MVRAQSLDVRRRAASPWRSATALLLGLAVVLAAVAAMVAPSTADAAAVAPAAITVGVQPRGIAMSPDGSFALVVNSGPGTVSRIRTSDNAVVATITVGKSPFGVAISPDGTFALVANVGGASVSRIRLSDNTVVATIVVGVAPQAVAIAPNGTFAYVTNFGGNSVSRLRMSDNTVVSTIAVGAGPVGIDISPDGSFAYVAESNAASVSRIRTSDNVKVATTSVGVSGIQPLFIEIAPNGSFAYVIKGGDSSISRLNTADNTVAATVKIAGGTQGLAISPDGTFAYVALATSGNLARVRTSDNAVTATFPVGPSPWGIAIAPSGAFAYTTLVAPGSVARVERPMAPPTNLVATPGNSQVSVAFTAPAGGDVAVTNYEYSINDGATWVTRSPAGSASPLVITGLTNKATYTVRLRAVNPIGVGPQSAAVTVVPTPPPATPTVTSVTPGPGSVTVNFEPPADNGGLPPTNYQYSVNDGASWINRTPASTASPLVITGLTNGIHAKVKLRAVNPAGPGPATSTVTVTVGTIPVGTRPAAVDFSPDGSYAYVVNRGASTVSRVRTADDRAVAVIPVGTLPGDVAISPTGGIALVTNRGSNTVTAIQTSTDTAIGTYPVGSLPVAVVFTPNGLTAYVVNQGAGTVTKLNIATGEVLNTIKVGTWPTDIAIDPAGTYLYVANGWERNVSKIATVTDKVVATLSVGESPQVVGNPYAGGPTRLALGRNGGLLFDTSDNGALITRVNTLTNSVFQVILGGTPRGVALRPDETQLTVTNEGGDFIWRFDPIEMTVQSTAFVGMAPAAVDYAPDGSFAYVANSGEASISRVGVAGAPTSLTPTAGNGSATIAFAPPASDGGASVTNYKYSTSTNGGSTWTNWTALNPADATSPVTIPGLLNGTAYQVKLRAVTSAGDGTPSTPVSVTPSTVPGAPTIILATGGVREIAVVFAAPASNGGAVITNYEYSLNDGPWTPRNPAGTASPIVITGLPNGAEFTIRLRAVNAAGPGTPSPGYLSATLPPLDAPTNLAATPGNASAVLSFTPPAEPPWAPVTNYAYSTSSNAGATWSAWTALNPADTTSPVTIPGLVNGTAYLLRLRAVNAVGNGAASAAVPVTPVAPGPPGMVFVPVDPARVLDTRVVNGGAGPIPAESSRVVSVAVTQSGGAPVVPAGATAIAYNLTVPNPTAAGHLRVMPGDAAQLTGASAINFRRGETIANGLTVKVDAARQIKIYAGASADVVVDVVGYFVPQQVVAASAVTPAASPAGSRFTPVTPVRVYDAGSDPLPAQADRLVSTATTQAGGTAVVPAGATAVAYNITVVRPVSAGHLRVMPGDVASSQSSTINWTMSGDVIANGLVVRVDAQRQVRVFNATSDPVVFLLDVVGYYSASGALFYPTEPARVLDTRPVFGGAGPILGGEDGVRTAGVATALVGGAEHVPAGATAIAYNLTVTGTTSVGHMRVWPADRALVTASTINWPGAGYSRANGTVVAISPSRQVKLYNGSSTPTDALIDVMGYYR